VSYDLMVFVPAAPPADRAGFMAWFDAQVKWDEDRDYSDPTGTDDALRAWFLEMIGRYPAMNGPYATEDFAHPETIAGYTIGRSLIYIDFRWSALQDAYRATLELAMKHRLGFFDVSAEDGQVWVPDGALGYRIAHGVGCSSVWPGKSPI
jgi:hypothetical protein